MRSSRPSWRGDVTLVAGGLFRGAGFLTLVLYAMNRRYWINDKGAFLESRGFRRRPPRFHATVARVLGKPGRRLAELRAGVESMLKLARELGASTASRLNSAPTASVAQRLQPLSARSISRRVALLKAHPASARQDPPHY